MRSISFLLASFLAFSCSAASACSINYLASQEITDLIKDNAPAWKISDSTCKRIAKNKLSLSINGTSGVLSGSSFAWVHVVVMRPESRSISPLYMASTFIDTAEASTPRAKELQLLALNDAIDGYKIDQALDELGKIIKLVK